MNGIKIHIIPPGTHTDANGKRVTFDDGVLSRIASNYNPTLSEAPLVTGHPVTDSPARGWVDRVEHQPGVGIFAVPKQVTPEFQEWCKAGHYKKVSASLYPPGHPHNPLGDKDWYLRHVGFLGGTPPAIKGLQQAQFADRQARTVSFADDESVTTVDFATRFAQEQIAAFMQRMREWIIENFTREQAEQLLPQWGIDAVTESAGVSGEQDERRDEQFFGLLNRVERLEDMAFRMNDNEFSDFCKSLFIPTAAEDAATMTTPASYTNPYAPTVAAPAAAVPVQPQPQPAAPAPAAAQPAQPASPPNGVQFSELLAEQQRLRDELARVQQQQAQPAPAAAPQAPPAPSAAPAAFAFSEQLAAKERELAAARAQLNKLGVEFSEREQRDKQERANLQAQANRLQAAEDAVYFGELVKQGVLAPKTAKDPALPALMSVLRAAEPVQFSDGTSKSPAEMLKVFLAGLPKTVDYGEFAPAAEFDFRDTQAAQGRSGENIVSFPAGGHGVYTTAADKAEDQKVRAYMAKHPTMDYSEAAIAVASLEFSGGQGLGVLPNQQQTG